MSNPSEKLLIAAANGNLNAVIQELQNNANINATDLNGYSPIHCAVYNNKVEVVKYLVKMGANLLMKDTHAYVGFTPLHYASAFGSTEMVKALLLSNDKNLHCKNSTGQTPADVASNSEVKSILLKDEKERNTTVQQQQQLSFNLPQQQPLQQQQQEEVINPENTSSLNNESEIPSCEVQCCDGKKKVKKILGLVAVFLFFAFPAFHLFTTPDVFPYYIFPSGFILWVAGIMKIFCKTSKIEKLKNKRGLMVHAWTALVFNVLMIVTCLATSRVPWFFFTLVLSVVILAIHKILKSDRSKVNVGLALHGVLYIGFVVSSYVLYCLVHMRYKSVLSFLLWFFPSAVWTVAVVLHFYFVKRGRFPIKISIQRNDVENQNNNVKVNETDSLKKNDVVENVKSEQNQSTIYPQVL